MKSEKLQQALGKENERIARRAYEAIQNGEAKEIGRLMVEAQQNFDRLVAPHASKQLASPLLHKLFEFEQISEHIYGGKGVGSQGDGTAQFVARSIADRDKAMTKIEKTFPQMRCFPLSIPQSISEDEFPTIPIEIHDTVGKISESNSQPSYDRLSTPTSQVVKVNHDNH